jgi:ribosome-binding protein aMBF1 (putative translation factor)
VRKHGRLLGFYLPARRKSDAEELQAAVRDLGESLAELRRETGLSEEKLVEEFAPKEREDPERMGG